MATVGTKQVIQMTKGGVEAMNNALGLYNKVLDQIIPWKTFEDTVKELDRYSSEYSSESAQLVSEIKSLMNNAHDSYHGATQYIYEWCSSTIQFLGNYRQLFDKRPSNAYEQLKAILIQVLDNGTKKMDAAQTKLLQSSASFNNAAGKLTTLHSRFTNEFDSKSSYYQGKVNQIRTEAYAGAAAGVIGGPLGLIIAYAIAASTVEGKLIPELNQKLNEVKNFFDHLKSKIDRSNVDIDATKSKLQGEVKNIGALKIQNEETKTLIPLDDLDALRDNVLGSVNALIAQCNEYQKRHGRKN